jgi:hypothetical protein
MAALMASFQPDLPIDGAAIILTALSVAVSPVNRAQRFKVRVSIFLLSSACLVAIQVYINLYVQQTFMFLFSYPHYRTRDSLVGIMIMPMERSRIVPGSSTNKGELFMSSTQHPDQPVQWLWGEEGIVLQRKRPGMKQVTQLSCRVDFQND